MSEVARGDYVVVTGGAGYIGSHTCKALLRAGRVPVVYDNVSSGHRRAVKWGPFEYGDILDRARLSAVLRKYRAAGVIHFAAVSSVGESVADSGKIRSELGWNPRYPELEPIIESAWRWMLRQHPAEIA